MAGVIESNQDITPEGLRGQMRIPPEKAQSYQAVVAAGKKILYSEQMDGQIQELLSAPGDIGDKLGQGVVGLIALIMDKAGGAVPPDVLIPAGVELVAEAGKFLRDTGLKVDKGDIAEGVGVFVETILQKAGVSLDQLPQMLGGQQQPQPQQPQQEVPQ